MSEHPGWHLDPSDPTHERLWDGTSWSPRTRPLSPDSTPSDPTPTPALQPAAPPGPQFPSPQLTPVPPGPDSPDPPRSSHDAPLDMDPLAMDPWPTPTAPVSRDPELDKMAAASLEPSGKVPTWVWVTSALVIAVAAAAMAVFSIANFAAQEVTNAVPSLSVPAGSATDTLARQTLATAALSVRATATERGSLSKVTHIDVQATNPGLRIVPGTTNPETSVPPPVSLFVFSPSRATLSAWGSKGTCWVLVLSDTSPGEPVAVTGARTCAASAHSG